MLNTALPTEPTEHKRIAKKRVVLVGQPNIGKSVLFNALTGRYVTVSNYSGTTVEVARGIGAIGDDEVEFIDSPGIHSLVAHSDEEKATRAILLSRPDCLVQVGSALYLSRALALTLELAELEIPMVLCLNMTDEALSRGYRVDVTRLSRLLGIPVVETVATTQEGVDILQKAILQAAPCVLENVYSPELDRLVRHVAAILPPGTPFLAPLLLQNHFSPQELAAAGLPLPEKDQQRIRDLGRNFLRPLPALFMRCRQEQALQVTAEVLSRPAPAHSGRLAKGLDRLGQWSLRPWPGYLFAMLILWGLYEWVGVLGAKVLVDFLERTVFGQTLNPLITLVVRKTIPGLFMQNLLVGEYGVFTMALTYAFALILPIVSMFFLALGFLEDSGYLPRLSVLLDRFFRLMGLNGKAVFPMLLGLGCGTMAMLTARILDTKKEKMLVSFLLALAVPCSAQVGVVLAMTAGVAPSVMAIWLSITVGSLLGVGWLASHWLPGQTSPFLIEIPPMRVPQAKNLIRKVAARLQWYLREVVPLFIWGTLGLYLLHTWGWLEAIERGASPIVTGWLGLPPKATEAFLVGFLRRDYGAAGLYTLQRQHLLTPRQVAVSIIAITLFMPCIAQWFMSIKERGLKFTLVVSGIVVSYALVISGLVNRILLMAGWL